MSTEVYGKVASLTPVARFIRDFLYLKGRNPIDATELLIQELDGLIDVIETGFHSIKLKFDK
ncbi:TPA: hypothetical protein ACS3VG_004349 [Klebsiella aerogenes]|uniref:hypothetical protein n=1 Tax=Klebsiella aerogenes TaxID=548 RepID=UPI00063C34BE|nr:hypothetical protein [Klebsiella aerogenes]KLF15083.1 hypothetical protein YA26_10950 [Klebsiella aerogenes]